MLEVEELDEHAAFQLSHALDVELGEPCVELHEVHLVATCAEVLSQLDDAPQTDAARIHGVDIADDQT